MERSVSVPAVHLPVRRAEPQAQSDTSAETPQLWNWDVAEVFIGWDFEHTGRYKELQVSPQGEWVDLDINRDDSKAAEGMKWNSGYTVKARIDEAATTWYGEMRIPFSAIDARPTQPGRVPNRPGIAGTGQKHYAWSLTGQANFHAGGVRHAAAGDAGAAAVCRPPPAGHVDCTDPRRRPAP